ncbi:MAG: type II secretion system F family protein, partial [Bacteroidota bacterium]
MSIDLSEFQAYQPAGKQAKATAARTGVFNRDIKLFGKVMTDKRKERFYHEMHTLFMAGVDIKAALELLEEEETTAKVKELYAKVRQDVVSGDSLSAAMTASDQFSAYEYHSIEIGEESGRITE